MPDAALIARLKCFGDVMTFRRCYHFDSDIENGTRTARMRLHTDIPSYLRLATESLLVIYHGQPRTCRRCNRCGHEAKSCSSYACYNCNEIGHVASACPERTYCSICKSAAHKANACPYAIIDDLDENLPISTVLAEALAAIPVIPTATNSVTSSVANSDDEEGQEEMEPDLTEDDILARALALPLSDEANTSPLDSPANLLPQANSLSQARQPQPDPVPPVPVPPVPVPLVPVPAIPVQPIPVAAVAVPPTPAPRKNLRPRSSSMPLNEPQPVPEPAPLPPPGENSRNVFSTSQKRDRPEERSSDENQNPFIRKKTKPKKVCSGRRKRGK